MLTNVEPSDKTKTHGLHVSPLDVQSAALTELIAIRRRLTGESVPALPLTAHRVPLPAVPCTQLGVRECQLSPGGLTKGYPLGS